MTSRRVVNGVGLAALLVAIAVATLGRDWHGRETAPGIWQDSPSLGRWLAWWMVVAVLGALVGARGRLAWRVVVIVPVLVWFAWMLRSSTLGPLAWLVYTCPTVLTWLGGAMAGRGVVGRWHAP